MNIPETKDPKVDFLQLVAESLSNSEYPWLMVLDNADDQEICFDSSSRTSQDGQSPSKALVNYIPRNLRDSILITTRDRRVPNRLANGQEPIDVGYFEAEDAKKLLQSRLLSGTDCNEQEIIELVETLDYIPLAITQAAAYIRLEGVSLTHYLSLLRDDANFEDVLEQDYHDHARDEKSQNAIFLTWRISFDQISRQKPRAAEILSLMAVLDRQSIVDTLLYNADESKVNFDTAIGTLKAFSLITEDKKSGAYGIHRLVQSSAQKWLKLRGYLVEWQKNALHLIFNHCPSNETYENWTAWEAIIPHVQVVLGYGFTTERSLLLEHVGILSSLTEYYQRRDIFDFDSPMRIKGSARDMSTSSRRRRPGHA